MSEGYECDRCGRTNSGPPFVSLVVGDGRSRTRRQVTNDMGEYVDPGPAPWDSESDLCRACWNDLRKWMEAPGGGFDYTPKSDTTDDTDT